MSSHNRLKKPKKVRRQFGAKKYALHSSDVPRIKSLIPSAF